jgi:hypothetical protein
MSPEQIMFIIRATPAYRCFPDSTSNAAIYVLT